MGIMTTYSWNGGVEGETDDPAISAFREKQIRNFFVLTLLSVGVPMICMGDELRRTQGGNNNAYCQDNEISWFDWGLLQKNGDIFRFVKVLIHSRLLRDMSKPEFSMTLNTLVEDCRNQVAWCPAEPAGLVGSFPFHFVYSPLLKRAIWKRILLSMHFRETLRFELPVPEPGRQWRRWIDTSLASPNDILHWDQAPWIEAQEYQVEAHTIVALVSPMDHPQLTIS